MVSFARKIQPHLARITLIIVGITVFWTLFVAVTFLLSEVFLFEFVDVLEGLMPALMLMTPLAGIISFGLTVATVIVYLVVIHEDIQHLKHHLQQTYEN